MAPPNPRIAELMSELETIAEIVAAARRNLSAGGFVDLAGLEDRVAQLCEALSTLPRADAGGFADSMASLVTDLDALSHAVRAQHNEWAERASESADAPDDETDDPGRAARAYGTKPPGRPS